MLNRVNPPVVISAQLLQNGLPLAMLAAIICAAGLAALLLWKLRSREPLLLSLGIFAALYGLRLLLNNELIAIATGADSGVLRDGAAIITYCIPIPLVIFLRELIGSGWKGSIKIWLRAQIGFAVVAIAAGLIVRNLRFADTPNSVLIIAGSLLLLVHLFFFYRSESGSIVVRSGFVVFFSCVLLTNLVARTVGPTLEPVGFLVLVCALGSVAALRTLTREQKLVAVEQELATARRIQASILPKSLPDMDGLNIATRYVPMTAVAGDFYDFLLIDQHRMTIVVADVSGHGVPAALIASMLKVGIAAQRPNACDPAAILTGLNTMLRGVMDSHFVTAACAFLDLEAHTITYSAAGHPPAYLARQGTQGVLELAENGLFLGPFPRAAYANMTVPFHPGDKLLLYTDGIIEATLKNGQPFGGEALKEFMIEHCAAGSSAFADDLIQAVSGSSQEDDLTVVVADAT